MTSGVIGFESCGYEGIPKEIEALNNELLTTKNKANSTGQNSIQKSNGDMVLTPLREFIYAVVIDITGGVTRQTFTIINDVITLASKVHATILPVIACVAIPVSLLVSGIGCLVTGLAWTLPDSCDDLAKAEWELASDPQAIKLKNLKEMLKAPNESLMIVDDAEKNELTPAIEELELAGTVTEAKEAVEIARLGVVNHYFYTLMGAFQIASAGVAFASSKVAHVFHYAPALTGHAASAAAATTAIALGIVYALRGAFMLFQSVKSYKKVDEFENELKGKKTLNKVLKFMKKKESEVLGSSYLNRRVDTSCLIEKKNEFVTFRYTTTGIEQIIKDGEKEIITKIKYKTAEDKFSYLERVSKGIYSEKFKHKIRMTIAAAMILGGVLTIVLAAISGVGLAAIGISLAAAIFFFLMESVYSTYDSSFVFQKLRDFFYERSNKPAWVPSLHDFSPDGESPPKALDNNNLERLFAEPQESELNKPNLEDDKTSDFESCFFKPQAPELNNSDLEDGEISDFENHFFEPQKSKPNKSNLKLENDENFSDFEGFSPNFQEPELKTNSVLMTAWNMMLKRMKIPGSSSPELRFVESD
jgi:hypothetical protein